MEIAFRKISKTDSRHMRRWGGSNAMHYFQASASFFFFFSSSDHTSCCGMCGRRKKLRCFPSLSLRSLAWEEGRAERRHHHLPPPFSRKLGQKKKSLSLRRGERKNRKGKSISSRQLPPACQRGRKGGGRVLLRKCFCGKFCVH